ncbi:MAG TPA: 30S ribosomal protein S19 [Candidatus Thermoplasmatota archaeon]|nr:30S ribosomal protein S19 [Candidatus Thermoplasmatota archaeon]
MADENTIPPTKAAAPRQPRRARKKKAAVETRRTKEAVYRGLTIAELQAMPWDQQLELLPARARRFFSRQFDHDTEVFWKKVQAAGEGDELRTHLRDFPITPVFVGKMIHIHNGKEFQKIGITTDMIGHKLGEFAATRKSVKHTGPGVGATRSSKFMPLK